MLEPAMSQDAHDGFEEWAWASARDVAESILLSGVSFAGGPETAVVVVGACAVAFDAVAHCLALPRERTIVLRCLMTIRRLKQRFLENDLRACFPCDCA